MTTAELHVSTKRRTQFVPITSNIAEVIASKGWQDGVITIFVPHTTIGKHIAIRLPQTGQNLAPSEPAQITTHSSCCICSR